MRIKEISLKNFFRYGNKEQTIDLTGSGVTAVTGFNGSGKSTLIVDSILFALYSKYRCDAIDDVVNRYTGKDCKVSVTFEEEGKEYKVIRYRKHSTHGNNVYLFCGDTDISGHTASETNNKIVELIKFNHIAFTNSSVFSTELYSAFLANKISERLVVFENILSLKEITLFYTTTKDIIKELNDGKMELSSAISSIESEIGVLTNTISTYNANAKTKLLSMKSNKERLKAEVEACNKKIQEYQIINIDEEKQKIQNIDVKKNIEDEIGKLRDEKSFFIVTESKEDLATYNRYKDVDFSANKAKEEKFKEDSDAVASFEKDAKEAFDRLQEIKVKKSSLEKEIESNKGRRLELEGKKEKLMKAICPFCGQHLTSEKSEEELKKCNEEIERIVTDNSNMESELGKISPEYDDFMEKYEYSQGEAKRIKDGLDQDFIPNTDLVKEMFLSAKNKVEEVEATKKKNAQKISEIDSKIKELSEKLDAILISAYTIDEINNIENSINEQKEMILNKEKEIASIDGAVNTVYDKSYVEGLQEDQKKKEESLASKREEMKKLEDEIFHYTYLGECFSNKAGGFKKYFIGEMIDVFNEKINQYLPFFFSEDVKIKFDKDLKETITMDDFEITFSSFSQGQRQRAELAISFALFDVARIFFNNSCNILILDEVDKGIDQLGLKAMVNLLNGFDKQLRILVISHNPLLEEEIPDKIKITKDGNGFSKIS